MPSQRNSPKTSGCLNCPYPYSYWREAFYLFKTRYGLLRIILFTVRNSNSGSECNRSFSRSDQLTKHRKSEHGVMPGLPGRGRKRCPETKPTLTRSQPAHDEFNTLRADTHRDNNLFKNDEVPPDDINSTLDPCPNTLRQRPVSPDTSDDLDDEGGIPPYLLAQRDPQTGLILGRSSAMVKYILMKAKHQHALEEHLKLTSELRVVRQEEKAWRQRNDALFDETFRVMSRFVIFSYKSHCSELNPCQFQVGAPSRINIRNCSIQSTGRLFCHLPPCRRRSPTLCL